MNRWTMQSGPAMWMQGCKELWTGRLGPALWPDLGAQCVATTNSTSKDSIPKVKSYTTKVAKEDETLLGARTESAVMSKLHKKLGAKDY
jgi:hypothetical protein